VDLGFLNIPRFEKSVERYQHFKKLVNELEEGRHVLAQIKNDYRMAALNGQMISEGFGSGTCLPESIAMWWIWRANEVGRCEADRDLENFFTSNSTKAISTLWISGLETDQVIDLTDKISILPVEKTSTLQQNEGYLEIAKIRYHGPSIYPFPVAAIAQEFELPKIYQFEESRKTIERISHELEDVAFILNCLPGVLSAPFSAWCSSAPDVPPGPFSIGGTVIPVPSVITPSIRTKVSEEDTALLPALFQSFSEIDDDIEKKRIRRALGRLLQAKSQRDINDKALDLGIALEMMLLTEHEPRKRGDERLDNLSLHFRLRGSWLLGGDADQRLRNYGILNKIYNHRSYVAHSGHFDEFDKKPSLRKTVEEEHIHVAEKIFQSLILNRSIDWKKLVVGLEA